MTAPIRFSVRVKYSSGAYVTNTINRQRASSTTSAERAVQALAAKLVTDRPTAVKHLQGNVAGGHETWAITA